MISAERLMEGRVNNSSYYTSSSRSDKQTDTGMDAALITLLMSE